MAGSQRGIEGSEFDKTGEDPKSPSKSSQKLVESPREFKRAHKLRPPLPSPQKNSSPKKGLAYQKFLDFSLIIIVM